MTAWKLRDEIAKERYLDMLAGAEPSVSDAVKIAAIAVEQADILVAALAVSHQTQHVKHHVTCMICGGAGWIGKNNHMPSTTCQACAGTGKVVA